MKKFIAFIPVFALVFSGCIKEPTACIDTFPDSVEVFEDVTFNSSCSENAESVEWEYEDITGGGFFFFPTVSTSTSPSFTHNWTSPGDYTITLTTYSKKEKEKDVTSSTITVLDICYECEKSSGGSTSTASFCSGFYSSLEELEAEVNDYEADGYTCVKKSSI